MKNTKAAKPILIGLTGRKRAGKDTVAAIIESKFGRNRVLKHSFAKPIREFVAGIMGVTRGQLEELKDSEYTIPGSNVRFLPRFAMQALGTEWGREVHPDIWVGVCERWIRSIEHEGDYLADYIVITDVRFDNEAHMIHRRGGYVVQVDRPSLGTSGDMHASERGVSSSLIDVIIQNDGSAADLYGRVTGSLMPCIRSLADFEDIRKELRNSVKDNQDCFINPTSLRLAA
jgi:hypothetical protein